MTRNELMIETLNETVSKVISENLNLVVTIKELQTVIEHMREETEKMQNSYIQYKEETNEKVKQLQSMIKG